MKYMIRQRISSQIASTIRYMFLVNDKPINSEKRPDGMKIIAAAKNQSEV
jgi:hypothetical protein